MMTSMAFTPLNLVGTARRAVRRESGRLGEASLPTPGARLPCASNVEARVAP
jgi:hypothetical protein